MDSPFLRSQWTQPSRPRSSSKPKVVSIPVHFVRSETSRSASALKIQKVFRGFVVRKSVKRIVSIKREVEEVERKVSQNEIVDLIRRDSKERLRVSETLMALLFKLDSVRGVDSGVRDFRKAVIKKAIALQERIDDIASGNQALSNVVDEDQSNDQTLEIKDSAENQTLEIEGSVLIDDDQALQFEQSEAPDAKEAHDSVKVEAIAETKDEICEKMDITEVGIESEVNGDEDGCVVKQIVEDENPTLALSDCAEESVETSPTLSSLNRQRSFADVMNELGAEQAQENLKCCVDSGDKGDYNKQLLERVMEDNEKMMSLMRQLVERNDTQTRMLSSLVQRVEHLERAFICDKLRKKKKKRHVTGTVDGLD